MIYETNLKNLVDLLVAAKLGGFYKKVDADAFKKAWNYAYANIEDKIPIKKDDIAYFEKDDFFLKFLERFAPEEVVESGKLTVFYKKIIKQALKLGLIKKLNIKENEDYDENKNKGKIYIYPENGYIFIVGPKIVCDLLEYKDMQIILSLAFIFGQLDTKIAEIVNFNSEEWEDVDFIF
ncbi:MAG: hypothetical protein ABGX25_01835 [Nautiliaceae bacterium]